MNTPKPCDTCGRLYVDCMAKDDPSHMAECKLGFELGGACNAYLPVPEKIAADIEVCTLWWQNGDLHIEMHSGQVIVIKSEWLADPKVHTPLGYHVRRP